MKSIFGIISVLLGIIGYWIYINDIKNGKVKPHAYSWLIWAILASIVFLGQLIDNAGAGLWVTAMTVVGCIVITLYAFKCGDQERTNSDVLCLVSAFAAMLLWILTDTPLWSMLLVTFIDFVGFIPTVRKTIARPEQETPGLFIFCGLKFLTSILATENMSVITLTYPISMIVQNFCFVALLVVLHRENQLNTCR